MTATLTVRFSTAMVAMTANLGVELLGVTVLPDTWWAIALIVGSLVVTLAAMAWAVLG